MEDASSRKYIVLTVYIIIVNNCLYYIIIIDYNVFPLTIYIYRVSRETCPTGNREVNEININVKVLYRFAKFAIISEILIFIFVLMGARRKKRSSRSRY